MSYLRSDHKDDQTDDVEQLRANLRDLRRRLTEAEELGSTIGEVHQRLEDAAETREQWIEEFKMELTEQNTWRFNPDSFAGWDAYEELRQRYEALIKEWNEFVPQYNDAVVSRSVRQVGRPLAASESQVARVLALRGQGRSYGWIAEATGLGLKTIRSIVTRPEREKAERQLLKRRALNREDARRYRARKAARERLESRITDEAKDMTRLLKATKGLSG